MLAFDCSPARILSFENRYATLSLWERVAFLSWLKKTFLETRDEMIDEIDQLLTEAGSLDQAEGARFPVAPVTLPLKAIKSELENAAKGLIAPGTRTQMATIPVASYVLLIDQYLVNSQYEHAWKRMDALKDLIGKERPNSFFCSFREAARSMVEGGSGLQTGGRRLAVAVGLRIRRAAPGPVVAESSAARGPEVPRPR